MMMLRGILGVPRLEHTRNEKISRLLNGWQMIPHIATDDSAQDDLVQSDPLRRMIRPTSFKDRGAVSDVSAHCSGNVVTDDLAHPLSTGSCIYAAHSKRGCFFS